MNKLKESEKLVKELKKKMKKLGKTFRPTRKKTDEITEFTKQVKDKILEIELFWEKEFSLQNWAFADVIPKDFPHKKVFDLNRFVFNLDFFLKRHIKEITHGDEYLRRITAIWREFLGCLNLFHQYEKNGLNFFREKSSALVYTEAWITREESIKALRNIILREYKRILDVCCLDGTWEPILTINHWDYEEVFFELKEKIKEERIIMGDELFPGEFIIQSSINAYFLIREKEKNLFVLDLSNLQRSLPNNSFAKEFLYIYKPRKFRAKDFFYRKYLNFSQKPLFSLLYKLNRGLCRFASFVSKWISVISLLFSTFTSIFK